MSTRCCTASFPYSQTVQAADSFHFLEKWYVARKHKVIWFFSVIPFDTEVMSLPVFVILQLWTTLLPCLYTGVMLVWSSRCYAGLGLLMGLVCSWGSSLACVDIAAGQGQRSSSFLLNHERELNISAFGALVCCVMSYIWKHFDESPIQWQLHTAGLFHNTVWKGNALFHSRLSTSVDSYIAQVCLSNQNVKGGFKLQYTFIFYFS